MNLSGVTNPQNFPKNSRQRMPTAKQSWLIGKIFSTSLSKLVRIHGFIFHKLVRIYRMVSLKTVDVNGDYRAY
mgnify:CR=1 FL=1